jgi:hypothetical protein
MTKLIIDLGGVAAVWEDHTPLPPSLPPVLSLSTGRPFDDSTHHSVAAVSAGSMIPSVMYDIAFSVRSEYVPAAVSSLMASNLCSFSFSDCFDPHRAFELMRRV